MAPGDQVVGFGTVEPVGGLPQSHEQMVHLGKVGVLGAVFPGFPGTGHGPDGGFVKIRTFGGKLPPDIVDQDQDGGHEGVLDHGFDFRPGLQSLLNPIGRRGWIGPTLGVPLGKDPVPIAEKPGQFIIVKGFHGEMGQVVHQTDRLIPGGDEK